MYVSIQLKIKNKIYISYMSRIPAPQVTETSILQEVSASRSLSDDAVLWVSRQKLTFGKDIGISSILGYKKQLLCQMIWSLRLLSQQIGVQKKGHLNLPVSKL